MKQWEPILTYLVQERGGALTRYATLLCGDQGEGEDLLQDALVKVFTHLRRSAEADPAQLIEHAEAYVRRTIFTLYLDSYRRRQRWAAVRHLLGGRGESATSSVDDRLDIETALATLGPKQRVCVLLRFYADLTVPQIAAELGVSDGTVKRHLHDANVTLGRSLTPLTEGDGL